MTVKHEKRKRLEAAGWKVGSAAEFLALDDDEAAAIEMKLDLPVAVWRKTSNMSMDLAVWAPRAFDLPGQLPRADEWVEHRGEYSFEGQGWQVLVMRGDEDPDPSVQDALPEGRHVAYVTLEPMGADRSGYDFLEGVVRHLARTGNGRWRDPDGVLHAHDEGSL